jgi:hypothetical protein
MQEEPSKLRLIIEVFFAMVFTGCIPTIHPHSHRTTQLSLTELREPTSRPGVTVVMPLTC